MVASLRGGGVRRSAELAVKRSFAAKVATAGSPTVSSDWEDHQVEGIKVSDAVGNGLLDRCCEVRSDAARSVTNSQPRQHALGYVLARGSVTGVHGNEIVIFDLGRKPPG
jgi:hypothetical protein